MKEATVVQCRCQRGRKSYGVRFEKIGYRHWKYTWAFPIAESAAKREGYDAVTVDGNIEADQEYPGCPYCHAQGFVICSCGKLNCFIGVGKEYSCAWCGAVFDDISAYDGGGFEGGGDR